VDDMNLGRLLREFGSDDKCREVLEELVWPDGVKCPRCQCEKVSHVEKRHIYDCDSCRYQFSVTAGTILHDTHLPLAKWFAAIYLMCESKKSISARQIQRMLPVASYKTAWYLCHRIRAAMKEVNPEPLAGTVEYDDTWHGGKRKGMGKGYVGNKTTIMGVIERDGPIRLKVEKRMNAKTVSHFLQKTVSPETERIYTDSAPTFEAVDFGTAEHASVDHSAQEWVRGDVHTNSIEGVWSLFKRSVIGAHHQLSEKHLQSYLDEQSFRFNNRKNPHLFRDTLKQLLQAKPLPFKKLTADSYVA
jgi:transposase-like protein